MKNPEPSIFDNPEYLNPPKLSQAAQKDADYRSIWEATFPEPPERLIPQSPTFDTNFRGNLVRFVTQTLENTRLFFGNRHLHQGILAMLALASSAPANFPEVTFIPSSPKQEISAPIITDLHPVPRLEARVQVEVGTTIEEIIASTYQISTDELLIHTPAIIQIESGGKLTNAMQVLPATAEESMADFKKIIGEKKYNQIISKMNDQQVKTLEGEVTFARYYHLVRSTFDKFSPKMQLDIALISYNGGINLTGEVLKDYLFHHPKIDQSALTWQEVYSYMHNPTHTLDFQSAYQDKFDFDRRPFSQWLENVTRYIELEAKAQK